MRRLQARHGLTVDGVVGPSTWAALGVSGAPTLNPPPSSLVHSSSSVGLLGRHGDGRQRHDQLGR